MKPAALYARGSTTLQEEQGTIASQITTLKERIAQDECLLDPTHEFSDNGVSGSFLARPGLDHLRDLASEGRFEVLYMLSPDRLARRYAHQCVVLEELSRWGVEVVFLNQPVTGKSPEDRLMINVLGVLAEYERELIRDRLRRGRLYKARQGQVFANAAAYGYRYIPIDQPGGGRWEVHESEAAVVQRIFRWCAEDKLPLMAICRRLNGQELGFDPVSPRKALRWRSVTVNGILRRQAPGRCITIVLVRFPVASSGCPRSRGVELARRIAVKSAPVKNGSRSPSPRSFLFQSGSKLRRNST